MLTAERIAEIKTMTLDELDQEIHNRVDDGIMNKVDMAYLSENYMDFLLVVATYRAKVHDLVKRIENLETV